MGFLGFPAGATQQPTMPTIGELLILQGVKMGEKIHAKLFTWDGGTFTGRLEVQSNIELSTELGLDPREATFLHVRRPLPALVVGSILTDPDLNQWRVLADREDNPANPTAKWKVEKVVNV